MQHMTEEVAVPMFEPDAESMPAEKLAELQQARLRGLLGRLLAAGGVQAGRLKDAGVTSGADVTLADLARLPMTGKDDLWRGYPFGMFAVPRDEVVARPAGGPRWSATPGPT
jgi:phenylacetate-coenzyme A ligase PaaK-like adenylate-forming protein